MKKVLEIFHELSVIPHCSSNTTKLKEYIVDFGVSNGFNVFTYKVGNIIARLDNSKAC